MKIAGSIIVALVLYCLPTSAIAQGGFHFGLKAGPTLASQSWNFGERRMAATYHANVFVESRDLNDKGSLFAQAGLHNRGSSITITTLGIGGNLQSGYNFQNVSLLVGAKKNVSSDMRFQPYYMLGIRGEYNLSENLEELILQNCVNNRFLTVCPYPDPIYVNKITYGITIGGGFELSRSDFFTSALEFSFSPDLSYQLQRPQVTVGGVDQSQLQVRNVSLEISLVLKFLREVIYEE